MQTQFEQFWSLFEGRQYVIGTDEGGCLRNPEYDWRLAHWEGKTPVGIYPMVPMRLICGCDDTFEWVVKWGCVDLDVARPGKNRYDYETEQDAHNAAVNLGYTLKAAGIAAWIEVTRSHGRHVWVFMDDWIPAATMRRALMVACDVADVPPTEVNPKSEGFDSPDTLGNYVRLPYPGNVPADRYMVNVDEIPYDRRTFLSQAWSDRNAHQCVENLASLWKPPTPRVALVVDGRGPYDGHLDGTVTPYIQAVLNQGPIGTHDRSGWLYWLAGKCREEGLSAEAALAVVHEADTVYTHKYVIRKDGERRLMEMIERQYA